MSRDAAEMLRSILDEGLRPDPLEHADQVAAVAAVLHRVFAEAGMEATIVGGSAIELHAPGVYVSADIDLVVEGRSNRREGIDEVFRSLGFERRGRHWTLKDLFVEVPSTTLTDPAVTMRVGDDVFSVIAKEVVLADRIVGFRHWGVLAWGQQAIDLLAAFHGDLDEEWLDSRLDDEGSLDALGPLRDLALSDQAVDREVLKNLLEDLGGRV